MEQTPPSPVAGVGAAATYAESRHQQPFDWNAFLAAPEHHWKEWAEAERLAGDWPTCAVGNQCAALPRAEGGQPKDRLLRTLGNQFWVAIVSRDIERAKVRMASIEARSALLLATRPA